MNGLVGKVALVTGGGSGIGEATARKLAEYGAKVVVADVNDEGAQRVADAIITAGEQALAVHLDVTNAQDWQEVLATIKNRFEGLHILFNNAGIGGAVTSIEEGTLEDWEKVIAVNQTSVWLGMKYGGALIKESGGGSIINTSSIFGIIGGFGSSTPYHASKGAVRLMTKNLALHWAKEGVRVNSVHPGFIDTPILGDADRDQLAGVTPMGRIGQPEEIANAVAFLASDLSSFMTGSELVVDGGYTAN